MTTRDYADTGDKRTYRVTVRTGWADGTHELYEWTGITAHGFDHAASRAVNKATVGNSPHLKHAVALSVMLERGVTR
jgi:hypothetical protein